MFSIHRKLSNGQNHSSKDSHYKDDKWNISRLPQGQVVLVLWYKMLISIRLDKMLVSILVFATNSYL